MHASLPFTSCLSLRHSLFSRLASRARTRILSLLGSLHGFLLAYFTRSHMGQEIVRLALSSTLLSSLVPAIFEVISLQCLLCVLVINRSNDNDN
jgi:hypothetical protein